MRPTTPMVALLIAVLAACGSGLSDTGEPGEQATAVGPTPKVATTAAPSAESPTFGETDGDAAAVARVGGRSYAFVPQRCSVTRDSVDISAGTEDGQGALLLQGDVGSPADFLVTIVTADFAYGYGSSMPDGMEPTISVDGTAVNVAATLDADGVPGGDVVEAEVEVDCTGIARASDTEEDVSDDETASGGSAVVELAGERHELTVGEVCSVGLGTQASAATPDGSAGLDIYVAGGSGFITFARPLAGEYWSPSNEVSGFDTDGDTATWRGPMTDAYSEREEEVSITVICDG